MSTDHMSRSSYDMYMYMIYIIISSNVMKCCRDSKSGERGEQFGQLTQLCLVSGD